jgi:DNA-directed RNA polymerase subunit RPC12/RpoP
MRLREFPVGVHATLADLNSWNVLTARCLRCGHDAELSPLYLAKWGKTALLRDIEKKLVCRDCGGKLVQLTVHNAPR